MILVTPHEHNYECEDIKKIRKNIIHINNHDACLDTPTDKILLKCPPDNSCSTSEYKCPKSRKEAGRTKILNGYPAIFELLVGTLISFHIWKYSVKNKTSSKSFSSILGKYVNPQDKESVLYQVEYNASHIYFYFRSAGIYDITFHINDGNEQYCVTKTLTVKSKTRINSRNKATRVSLAKQAKNINGIGINLEGTRRTNFKKSLAGVGAPRDLAAVTAPEPKAAHFELNLSVDFQSNYDKYNSDEYNNLSLSEIYRVIICDVDIKKSMTSNDSNKCTLSTTATTYDCA